MLGFNSDSICFEINRVFLLIVFLSLVTRGVGSWAVCWETSRYSFEMWFLRRIAKHLRSKLIMFILIVLSTYIILRSVSEWYGVYHSFRGSRNGYGRMQFLADDGNGIQNGMKLSFFVPGTS